MLDPGSIATLRQLAEKGRLAELDLPAHGIRYVLEVLQMLMMK